MCIRDRSDPTRLMPHQVIGEVCNQCGPDAVYVLSLIHISEPTRPLYIAYAVFCLRASAKAAWNSGRFLQR